MSKLAWALLLAACAAEPTAAPPVATALEVVDGAGQEGPIGYRLPREVLVRVRDDRGAPMAGVAVTFATDTAADGYAEPSSGVTDGDGTVRTWWRVGGPGTARLRATAPAVGLAAEVTAQGVAREVRAVTGFPEGICVLDLDGRIGCGAMATLGRPNPAPMQVVGGALRFVAMTNARVFDSRPYPRRVCAVAETGRVWCFGLGVGGPASEPAEVGGAYPPFRAIVGSRGAASEQFCALTADGEAWCWGGNGFGQLGDGSRVGRTAPVRVVTDARFTQLTVGPTTCGLTAAGAAWCWGAAGADFAADDVDLLPRAVPASARFTRVEAQTRYLTICGVAAGGGVHCWGERSAWPMPPRTPSWATEATFMPGTQGTVALVMVDGRAVTLEADGSAFSWGDAWPYYTGGTSDREAVRGPRYPLRDFLATGTDLVSCGTIRVGTGTLCVALQPGVGLGHGATPLRHALPVF